MELREFEVYMKFDDKTKEYTIMKSDSLDNLTNYLRRNKWIYNESSNTYYNFNKVISFQVSEK